MRFTVQQTSAASIRRVFDTHKPWHARSSCPLRPPAKLHAPARRCRRPLATTIDAAAAPGVAPEAQLKLGRFRQVMAGVLGGAGAAHLVDLLGAGALPATVGVGPLATLPLAGKAAALVWCGLGPLVTAAYAWSGKLGDTEALGQEVKLPGDDTIRLYFLYEVALAAYCSLQNFPPGEAASKIAQALAVAAAAVVSLQVQTSKRVQEVDNPSVPLGKERLTAGALSEVLTASDGGQYMVFVPASWSPEDIGRHPVLLFLHGSGGIGNEANIRGQSLTRLLADPAFAQDFQHIVLTPIAKQPAWEPQFDSILGAVELIVRECGGDAERVAVAGQSMGGAGAWQLAARHPRRFSAAVPVCGAMPGGPDPAALRALRGVPVWAFHAEDDSIVSVGNTDKMVEALEKEGHPAVQYTRYAPGLSPPCKTPIPFVDLPGHGCFELAFREEELWRWMLQQRKVRAPSV